MAVPVEGVVVRHTEHMYALGTWWWPKLPGGWRWSVCQSGLRRIDPSLEWTVNLQRDYRGWHTVAAETVGTWGIEDAMRGIADREDMRL